MAENSAKKRKRQSNGVAASNKRLATPAETGSGQIAVQLKPISDVPPVLLSSPGLTTPRIAYDAYWKPVDSRSSRDNENQIRKHDVLLHSAEHPRLDYTATPAIADQHLSHYVAVFDPSTHELQIVPASSLSLRGTLRPEPKDEEERQRGTITQQRAALKREFGTKKAQKAINDKTVNAIRQDATPKGKVKVQEAIFESMADSALPVLNQDQQLVKTLEAKPIPKPNLEATEVEDVYTFDTLVPPTHSLLVDIKEWQANVKNDVDIQFNHMYPAFRVVPLGKTDDLLRFKALRYLTFLLEFLDALQGGGRGGKKVPKRDVLKRKLGSWPEGLIDAVRNRFANPQNELPKWYMDNLYTHICALTLYIDGWTTDISHLKHGLKMENKEVMQYFRELGCKVGLPTEKERDTVNRWWTDKKMTKEVAAGTRVAKLTLPLQFPKVSTGRRA